MKQVWFVRDYMSSNPRFVICSNSWQVFDLKLSGARSLHFQSYSTHSFLWQPSSHWIIRNELGQHRSGNWKRGWGAKKTARACREFVEYTASHALSLGFDINYLGDLTLWIFIGNGLLRVVNLKHSMLVGWCFEPSQSHMHEKYSVRYPSPPNWKTI